MGLAHSGVNIVKGRIYRIDFTARANPPTLFKNFVGLNAEPYTAYSGERYFNLTAGDEAYSFTFTMWQDTDPAAVLNFMCGGHEKSVITFGNVRITDLGPETQADTPSGDAPANH